MAEPRQDGVVYYYDIHPTEEDLMGEAPPHARLVHYLMEVLAWQFRGQLCALYENYNFYQTDDTYEYPLAPDIAVIKGVLEDSAPSWRVGVNRPAPQVVFEIASRETWKRDLHEKPAAYAEIGVKEYYAYDPGEPPLLLSRRKGRRLFGWQRDGATGQLRELAPGSGGRLWSPQLESFLVPDGKYVRLYDRFGSMRLTQGEAEAHRAEEAVERIRILAEKLRSLGIDPDQLL